LNWVPDQPANPSVVAWIQNVSPNTEMFGSAFSPGRIGDFMTRALTFQSRFVPSAAVTV
jgi:hypothetical protein